MFLLEYINPLVFFIALGIGIFIAYLLKPTLKIVYKYPTLDNADKTKYIDDKGVCYKYTYEEVKPPGSLEDVQILSSE